jgi:hypothetical protein
VEEWLREQIERSQHTIVRMNKAGEVEMRIEGGWFHARLSSWPGRWAARMYAFASVCEGKENDALAKAILNEVGREEYRE